MGSIELSTFFHMNYIVHIYTIKMAINDSIAIYFEDRLNARKKEPKR